jgi:hypothetical protein
MLCLLEKYMGENMEGKRNISMLMTVVLEENWNLERRDQGKVPTIYLR